MKTGRLSTNLTYLTLSLTLLALSSGCEGTAGLSSLVLSSDEPAGSNCALGGVRLSVGLDSDNNGELSEDEISQVSFLCRSPGFEPAFDSETLDPGAICAEGGTLIRYGIDLNRNSVLDPEEIRGSLTACHGETGPVGLSSISVMSDLAPGASCPAGGVTLRTGLDQNRNGVLDAEEIADTRNICHGQNGFNSLVKQTEIAEGTPGCENGGILIESGLDLDRDGTLSALEVTASSQLCVSCEMVFGPYCPRTQTGGFTLTTEIFTGHRPAQVATGDLNGDGSDDLIWSDYDAPTIHTRLSNGDGTFQGEVAFAGGRGERVLVADFDNDGKLDIVSGGASGGVVCFHRGLGTGAFAPAHCPGTTALFYNGATQSVADLNGDGNLDILGGTSGMNVQWLAGAGDGTFSAGTLVPMSPNLNTFRTGQTIAVDLNGDGRLDLVSAAVAAGTLVSMETARVAMANASGGFQASQTALSGSTPGVPTLAAGDVNGDRIPDLLLRAHGSAPISVLLGRGEGSFDLPRTTPLSASNAFFLADLNGDRRLDIVSGDGIHIGTGEGGFFSPQQGPFVSANWFHVADVNGDGKRDVISASLNGRLIRVYLGL